MYFATELKAAIIRYKVAGLVVGWPLDPFGHESIECRQVAHFIDRLRDAQVLVPILLWDERGSSLQAKENIRAKAKPRGIGKATRIGLTVEQRRNVDEEAAAVLLQGFLEAARKDLPLPVGHEIG